MRGLEQGLCSLGYDQLAQINGVNTNIASLNSNLNNAICTLGYNTQQGFNDMSMAMVNNNNAQTIAMMQNQNALQSQLAQCCCNNKALIKDLAYEMATNTCAINTNLSNSTRDIVDSQNANTRAILEAIQANRVEAMQAKIAELQATNNQLAFQASQQAQNAYLINELKPCPQPCYAMTAPQPITNFGYNTCSCNGVNALIG